MQLTVITTGASPALSTDRTRQAERIVAAQKGLIQSAMAPQHELTRDAHFGVHHLPVLALSIWGLTHSDQVISPSTLMQRTDFDLQPIRGVLREWIEAGWLELAQQYDRSNPGRPQPILKLTAVGKLYIDGYFCHFTKGYRLTIEAADQSHANAIAHDLKKIKGLIIADPRPVHAPARISAAILMASWILEQSNEMVNHGNIADLLICRDVELIVEFFTILVRLGHIGTAGVAKKLGQTYRLTPLGRQLSLTYLSSVLA